MTTITNNPEHNLKIITDNLPGFAYKMRLMSDGKEQLLYANDKVFEIYGIEKDQALEDISLIKNRIHKDDLVNLQIAMKQSAKELTPVCVKFRVNHPKKGELWLERRATPTKNEQEGVTEWHGITLDITAQMKSQEQLRKITHTLSALITAIPDFVWMKDKEGVYLSCNKAYEEFLNTPRKNIIGKTDFDFYTKEEAEICWKSDLEAIYSKGIHLSQELIRYRKTSQIGIWEVRKVPVRKTNGEMIGILGIARDITKQIEDEKRIGFIAHYDILTSLPNRTLLRARADQIMKNSKRNSKKAAFLFVDLDGFKTINDSLGHSVGDIVLKEVAYRLKSCTRASDILSRHGGDEFILVLSEINQISDVELVVKKVLKAFEKPFEFPGRTLSVTASIGVAFYPEHGDTFERLLQNADTAMYKAKEKGKNTYCFYLEDMKNDIEGFFQIQNDLKTAIENNQFLLHYQPQIDLEEERILGVEALIRWRHPSLGMIPPMSFISVAESCGLIVPIGEWVINEACRQASSWNQNGKDIVIAVNVSALQFKRGNFVAIVKKALETSGLDPKYLELELTESILIGDTENVLKTVKELKELGVQLSIDDFGTGYSSLAYLKRFAVDKLKIDQSFVRDILKDKEDATIVKTIIAMAKSFNLKSIAEGVENEEVLKLVKEFGCDEVQGYHFAKPMGADEFKHYYRNIF